MKDLVDRVSTATGLEPETAQKAIGIVFNFIGQQLPPDRAAALMASVPGAREAATGAATDEDAGGLMGADGGGLMGLANQLSSEGLGMAEMQSLGREMFTYLRQHAGDEVVGEIAASTPGLAQFM